MSRARSLLSRRLATPLAIGLGVAVALAFAFWELAEDVALVPGVDSFDRHVSAAVWAWRTPALTVVFKAVTAVGNTATMVALAVVVMAVLLWRRRTPEARLFLAAVVGGALLSDIGKGVTARVRPPAVTALIKLPASFSFPSGHAMASLMFFGTLAYFALRVDWMARWHKTVSVIACVAAAIAVGLSRVYLGVHWPSDVIASWCLGGAWLALVISWFEAWERSVAEARAES